MERHFAKLAHEIQSRFLEEQGKGFVVEIGCNDGILLKNFSALGIKHLGIEPSLNVALEAKKAGCNVLNAFFSKETAIKIVSDHGPANVIVAANVMCHISDIQSVLIAVQSLLDDSGILIFEDPYFGDVIDRVTYDQIYDEHVFLFSLHSVQSIFQTIGLEVFDIQAQNTHGGSMRYFLAKQGKMKCSPEITALLQKEKSQGLHDRAQLSQFKQAVVNSKESLLELLRDLKEKDERVVGYAATSKSTTILNYCGIGTDLVSCIYDTTPEKIGKFSPGMNIPIKDHKLFADEKAKYVILFAWNHQEEIFLKEKSFANNGGCWILHTPSPNISND